MEASQVDLENCSDELRAAHEFAAAAAAAVAKSRKVLFTCNLLHFVFVLFYFKLNYIFYIFKGNL